MTDLLNEIFGFGWEREMAETADTTTPSSSTPTPMSTNRPASSNDKKSNSIKGNEKQRPPSYPEESIAIDIISV